MNESISEPLPVAGPDGLEFSAALLLGAAIGVLLTRALRPERTASERMGKALRRPAGRVRRRGRSVRESAIETARESGQLGRELRSLGEEFIEAARDEWDRRRSDRTDRSGRGALSAAIDGFRAFRSRLRPDP